jgi:hypothetical protein
MLLSIFGKDNLEEILAIVESEGGAFDEVRARPDARHDGTLKNVWIWLLEW